MTFQKKFQPKVALLIIDMQNGFLGPEAVYDCLTNFPKLIPNIKKLLFFCRDANIPVIWTQSDISKPYCNMELELCWRGAQEDKIPQSVRGKGTWGFELHPEMQPLENEYRVVKRKYDAFFETDLDSLLRNLKVDTLIITGVSTNCCCETTARSGFCRNYDIIFASDGTGAIDLEIHKASLRALKLCIAKEVLTVDEIIAELKDLSGINPS